MSWLESFSLLHEYKLLNSSSSDLSAKQTSYFTHHLKKLFIIFIITILIGSLCYFINNHTKFEFNFKWPIINQQILSQNDNGPTVQTNYHSQYLIHTLQCIIPNIPVFNFQTRKLFQKYPSKHYHCDKVDITSHIRRVNSTFIQIPSNLSCTAREIVREAQNESVAYGSVFAFLPNQTVVNFPNSDAVEVTCNLTYKRIVPLIPKKEPIWQLKTQVNPILAQSPNVLLIGIDSVSRLNFMRHLNETHKFITERHFEGPLYGLQKVGDNTWPNLMAVFTGEPQNYWYKALPQNLKLDRLPLIFKSFSQAGYLTSYIENSPNFGLWTYHGKNGFEEQPFEYFLRPVNLLVYKELNHKYCYKEKLELELYYHYVYDQMMAFRERGQKYFTFVHMGSVTHDILNHAQYLDHPVKQFLTRIFRSNLHNNTLIIFYSDHGIRYGMRLLDSDGEWMDDEKLKQVFRANCRRVTSHFDVHATLRHVLNRAPSVDEYFGRSLFTPIPIERTCEDAGIPDEYCLCYIFKPLNSTKLIHTVAEFAVQHLNAQLKPFEKYCHTLTFLHVINAKVTSHLNSTDKQDPKRSKQIFSITIQTKPGNGTFESTIRGYMSGDMLEVESLQNLGKPLRQDRYAEQSYCVANSAVESMCYCRDPELELD